MSKKDRDFLKTVFTARECKTVQECISTLEKIGEYTNKTIPYTPYPPCIVRRRKSIIAKMDKLKQVL